MKKRLFKMNGKTYTSMLALAKELGKARIYPKDFDKYGITEVTDADSEVAVTVLTKDKFVDDTTVDSEIASTKEDSTKKETPKKDEPKKDEPKKETPKKETPKKETPKKDEPIDLVHDYKSIDSIEILSKLLKSASIKDIVSLGKILKLDIPSSDERIMRMKLTASIKNKLFPGQQYSFKKKPSEFRKFSLELLLNFAKEKQLSFIDNPNKSILRMRVTSAIKHAGYTANDLKEKEGDE